MMIMPVQVITHSDDPDFQVVVLPGQPEYPGPDSESNSALQGWQSESSSQSRSQEPAVTVGEPELPAPANLSTSLRLLPCQQQCQPAIEATIRQPYHKPTVAPGPASARGAGRGRVTLTLAGVLRDSLWSLL